MISLTNIIVVDFAIGIFIGEVLDFVYDRKLNNKEDEYFRRVPKMQSLFHWFEHYHWGMVLLMGYCPIMNGIGLSLILDENRSELGFGYEKDPEKRDEYYHFFQSSMIGIVIFISLLCRWLFFPS
jgi:hypothetical protein